MRKKTSLFHRLTFSHPHSLSGFHSLFLTLSHPLSSLYKHTVYVFYFCFPLLYIGAFSIAFPYFLSLSNSLPSSTSHRFSFSLRMGFTAFSSHCSNTSSPPSAQHFPFPFPWLLLFLCCCQPRSCNTNTKKKERWRKRRARGWRPLNGTERMN